MESALHSFDSGEGSRNNPGALKILLRSSGIQPGIDNLGKRNIRSYTDQAQTTAPQSQLDLKGKRKAQVPNSDPDLDIKATQVLDILPDTSPEYIKLLLAHDRYGRDPEKVLGALLEGAAMSLEDPKHDLRESEELEQKYGDGAEVEYRVEQRRNVFEDERVDLSRYRVGRKDTGFVFSSLCKYSRRDLHFFFFLN